MSYCTVEDLRQYLDQPEINEPNEDAMTAVLARAQSIVDGALSFTFADYGAASVKAVQSYGGVYLELPPLQASSVTSIATAAPSSTIIPATDYVIEGRTARRIMGDGLWVPTYGHGYGWPMGWLNITAVWGYGPVPASVQELVIELAVNIWRSKDKGLFTEVIGVEGGDSVRYIGGLNAQQRMIIENAKLPFMAVAV